MAKNPDERYASAAGVAHDLRRLAAGPPGDLSFDFALGERDRAAPFAVPDRLYGREAALQAALERASELIKGLNLYQSLRTRCAAGGGGGGCGGGSGGTLACGEPARSAVQEAVRGALGRNARLLTDAVPSLRLLVGADHPPLMPLPPAETRARFCWVFTALLRAAAGALEGKPLLLFVDDCQWIDADSLQLVAHLAADRDLRLAALLAFRENEIGENAAWGPFVEELRGAGARPLEVAVPPLGLPDVSALLRDIFVCRVQGELRAACGRDLGPLAAALLRKTGGNPFHLCQLLRLLHRRRAIRFSHASGEWEWAQDEVESSAI
eukprot:tig00020660_g12552.t1